MINTISNQVADNLLQIKAIKLSPQNPFTWASGMRSPIYCDNRVSLSHPKVRTMIKEGLAALSQSFDFEAVAGVATAGIAHGALLADYLNLPFCYVRAEAKSHGRQNKIEGELPPASKVLVIEDLISTGGSSIAACKVLEEAGFDVVGVLAIFDYQFAKAKENFKKAGINFETLSNYEALMEEAQKQNYITSSEQDVLRHWNSNPDTWFESFYSDSE